MASNTLQPCPALPVVSWALSRSHIQAYLWLWAPVFTIAICAMMVTRASQLSYHASTPSVHSSIPSHTASIHGNASKWNHHMLTHHYYTHTPLNNTHAYCWQGCTATNCFYTLTHSVLFHTHLNPRQMQSKPIATHAVMPSQTLIPHASHPCHQLQTHINTSSMP